MRTGDFTRAEAAKELRIGTTALDEATKAGRLGCYRYGRHITYGEHHLAAYRLLNEKHLMPTESRRLINVVLNQLEVLRQLADAA